MWTPAARAELARESLPYASSLTDAEWALIVPLLPEPSGIGRPWRWPLRAILDGIQYVMAIPLSLRRCLSSYDFATLRFSGDVSHRSQQPGTALTNRWKSRVCVKSWTYRSGFAENRKSDDTQIQKGGA